MYLNHAQAITVVAPVQFGNFAGMVGGAGSGAHRNLLPKPLLCVAQHAKRTAVTARPGRSGDLSQAIASFDSIGSRPAFFLQSEPSERRMPGRERPSRAGETTVTRWAASLN